MDDNNFILMFCETCIQMTNHLDGVCQKCKKRDGEEDDDLDLENDIILEDESSFSEDTDEISHHEKREDKIFNNSYYNGDNLKGDEYSFSNALMADDRYAKSYLRDIYEPEDNMQYTMVRDEILKLLDSNEYLRSILDDNNNKKFNKEKINEIFSILLKYFTVESKHKRFVNLIYVFDNISNLTGLKYNNLFDLLEYDYKELLIIELDTHFNVLNTHKTNSKMF